MGWHNDEYSEFGMWAAGTLASGKAEKRTCPKVGAVLIIRGLPGSGKTTWARKISKQTGAVHIEADQYLETPPGVIADYDYLWTPERSKAANKAAMDRLFQEVVIKGRDCVVSNTFTTQEEIDNYLARIREWLGEFKDSLVLGIFKATGDFGSVHNVPAEVIEKMKNRWEDIPGEKEL